MSMVDNTRPPYVQWESRAVEDRTASLANGHYTSKNVDFAVITRPGSRDTIEKEALPWLAELRLKAQKKEIPENWYPAFVESHKFWKDGEELPLTGTPIKGWPVLSPAAQKDLVQMGIRTVEDLAAFSDSELGLIGTGAASYKQKAQAWLAAASGPGKVAEQLSSLQTQLSELLTLTQKQAEEIKTLRTQVPQAEPKK